ncbi:MAG TPA: SatD family protein [Spirochaetales bacterium]|nr:SatD family protein [Spirochaetales bacterium]
MKALCVIADLVDSRGIADRGRFQRGLKASLEALSSRRGARLLSPYTITLGDEFQALYRDSGTLLADFA